MREKKGWWEVRDKQGRNTWPEERYTREQVLVATMTVELKIMCSRCLNSPRGMIRQSHTNKDFISYCRCLAALADNSETSSCIAQQSLKTTWTGLMVHPGLIQVWTRPILY